MNKRLKSPDYSNFIRFLKYFTPAKLAAIVLTFFSILVSLAIAWKIAQTVPTFHLDGAFQTGSAMFHIKAGDIPGRDFLPYLGIGPLLLMAPTFFIFGSTLTASVASAYFVTLTVMQIIVGFLATLILRKRSFLVGVIAAALITSFVGISYVFGWEYRYSNFPCNTCVTSFFDLSNPGNSLRPLRSFAPYIFAFAAYIYIPRTTGKWSQLTGIGLFTGALAAIWSNDYGLVSAVTWLGLFSIFAFFRLKWKLIRLVLMNIVSILGYLFALFITTAGNPKTLLEYNFMDVRGDQFWYYAPWFPEGHIFGIGALVRDLIAENAVFPILLLCFFLVIAIKNKQLEFFLVFYVGSSLLLGGMIATVAGHIDSYFWAFRAWGVISLIWLIFSLIYKNLSSFTNKVDNQFLGSLMLTVKQLLVGLTLVLIFCVATSTLVWAISNYRALKNDQRYIADKNLGGYISLDYENFLESIPAAKDGEIVEEYWGLLSASQHVFSTQKVDSVIHALGQQRTHFAQFMLGQPKYVVTTSPEMDWAWLTWNMSANWWLYKPLFSGYSPRVTTPTTVLWTESPNSTTGSAVTCSVDKMNGTVTIDASKGGLYQVDLRYRGQGKYSRSFTMIQNNLNYPYQADGFLALDPGAAHQEFPVWVTYPGKNVLQSRTTQGPNSNLSAQFISCEAELINYADPFSVQSIYFPPESSETLDISDSFWRHGVSVSGNRILLQRSLTNFLSIKNSKLIEISSVGQRGISDVQMTTAGVEVGFEGDPIPYQTVREPLKVSFAN